MELYKIQDIQPTDLSGLVGKVKEFKDGGYRMGQICGTRIQGGTELLYSFDKDCNLSNLRLTVTDGESVPSITEMYWSAFIYENEIHDLFGVKFMESRLDYEGRFFRLAQPTPWKTDKKEAE